MRERLLTLTILEVIDEDMKALTFNAVIFDDNTAAANNLSRIPLLVNLAETGPGSELLRVRDFDEVDFMFGAEGLNEFDVFGFRASLDEDTQVGLTFVQSFRAFTQTSSKTIVNQRIFQNLLISGINHLKYVM